MHGHNPTELYFDQEKMRLHLIDGAINVSCGEDPKEEKGDTETHN